MSFQSMSVVGGGGKLDAIFPCCLADVEEVSAEKTGWCTRCDDGCAGLDEGCDSGSLRW